MSMMACQRGGRCEFRSYGLSVHERADTYLHVIGSQGIRKEIPQLGLAPVLFRTLHAAALSCHPVLSPQ
ncbi:hypothetical protein HDE77_000322 [Rhodanobacter sp. MP7CTX1]|nr:hypothetical protein [Rhodanobacter sp. MP7CTX1]